MRRIFSLNSFSVRLLLGFVILIVLTTLSAGMPAFWLTRTQLERQAWSQVSNAQSATQSLLEAEQNRVESQLTLFAERPTLQQLIRAQAVDELQLYLQAFQSQSELNILLLCTTDDLPLFSASSYGECIPGGLTGFQVLDGRPVVLAQQVVIDDTTGQQLGTAAAGTWLEAPFLQHLTAATGMQQSILNSEGRRLSSTFAAEEDTAVALHPGDRHRISSRRSQVGHKIIAV